MTKQPEFCFNCGEVWSLCACEIPSISYPELVEKLRKIIAEQRPSEKEQRTPPLDAEWCVDAFWRVNPGRNATVPSLYLLDFAREVLRVYAPVSATPAINTVPLLKRIREQRDRLADVLRWLDALGGLGLDKHARIREALDGIPTYEEQLRNIAKGIGMDYDELLCRLDGGNHREGP